MNTKKSILSLKNVSGFVAMLFVILASCQKDSDILTAADTQNVNAESASAAYSNESSGIAGNAIGGVNSSQYSGARSMGEVISLGAKDDRLSCATVTIVRIGTKDAPKGTITIDFGTGCTDPRGVTRSGKIIIDYSGKRWTAGSYFVIHPDGFKRNDATIEGVDSLTTQVSTDSLHLQFQSILTGGKVTFGDGKFITRDHNLTREWIRSSIPLSDEWITLANTGNSSNGTATGTTKNNKTYLMQITKNLVEKASCRADKIFIPVQGTKVITVGNEQYTVDYGDGACDNTITVTLGGKVKEISVTPEGN